MWDFKTLQSKDTIINVYVYVYVGRIKPDVKYCQMRACSHK